MDTTDKTGWFLTRGDSVPGDRGRGRGQVRRSVQWVKLWSVSSFNDIINKMS